MSADKPKEDPTSSMTSPNSAGILKIMATVKNGELNEILNEAKDFYKDNVELHAKGLKANQKALELFKAKINASVDSAILQFNKYEETCSDEEKKSNEFKDLKTALSKQKIEIVKEVKKWTSALSAAKMLPASFDDSSAPFVGLKRPRLH